MFVGFGDEKYVYMAGIAMSATRRAGVVKFVAAAAAGLAPWDYGAVVVT